jgi:hypothetical protein
MGSLLFYHHHRATTQLVCSDRPAKKPKYADIQLRNNCPWSLGRSTNDHHNREEGIYHRITNAFGSSPDGRGMRGAECGIREVRKSGEEAFLRSCHRPVCILHKTGQEFKTPIRRKEHNISGRRPATEAVRGNGTPPCVTWASRRAARSKPSRSRGQYNRRKKEAAGLPVEPNGLRTEANSLVLGIGDLQVSTCFVKKRRPRHHVPNGVPRSLKNSPLCSRLWGHRCQQSTMRHRDWSDDSGRRT